MYSSNSRYMKVRLGIVGNDGDNCVSTNSFVGLGTTDGTNYPSSLCGTIYAYRNAAGNLARCSPDNGNKNIRAMAYILVR